MRWAVYVAGIGKMKNVYIWLEKPNERNQFEGTDTDMEIMLEMGLSKIGFLVWTGFIWFKIGIISSSIEHCNKVTGSTRAGEFLDQASDYCVSKDFTATSCLVIDTNSLLSPRGKF
jgi:hypothetical protein